MLENENPGAAGDDTDSEVNTEEIPLQQDEGTGSSSSHQLPPGDETSEGISLHDEINEEIPLQDVVSEEISLEDIKTPRDVEQGESQKHSSSDEISVEIPLQDIQTFRGVEQDVGAGPSRSQKRPPRDKAGEEIPLQDIQTFRDVEQGETGDETDEFNEEISLGEFPSEGGDLDRNDSLWSFLEEIRHDRCNDRMWWGLGGLLTGCVLVYVVGFVYFSGVPPGKYSK